MATKPLKSRPRQDPIVTLGLLVDIAFDAGADEGPKGNPTAYRMWQDAEWLHTWVVDLRREARSCVDGNGDLRQLRAVLDRGIPAVRQVRSKDRTHGR